MSDLEEKKKVIAQITNEFLNNAFEKMQEKITRAIQCDALDIEQYDSEFNTAIIPKTIVAALLLEEAEQWKCKGTSFEKQMEKDVKQLLIMM